MRKLSTPSERQLLADFLVEIREKADLSQARLAKKLDVSQGWVFHRENLTTPMSLLDFVHWCRACEVEPGAAFKRFCRSLEA